MKTLFLIIALVSGALTQQAMSQTNIKTATNNSSAAMLRHVVIFKFKDTSTPQQIKTVEDAFSALPGKINTIVGYEWGTNVSPENLAQGFTHCFLVTFKDVTGRDFYLPHPAHKEFGKILGPHLDKVLVIDFVGKQ
jgi:hypothetical protein